jgi:ATP-dependent exoDNAse (exonuclease V) beta subunit
MSSPRQQVELSRALLSDAALRRAALDTSQSWLLQAPAGSGKTELLMQRFLACLAQVERPECVLAITFTRKAAAEMRSRVVGALRDALKLSEDEIARSEPHRQQTLRLARQALEHSETLGWRVLDQPGRLQVRTLDSFCEALVQRAPSKGALGGAVEVTEDAASLYELAAQGVINELSSAGKVGDAVAMLLSYLDNDLLRCRELLAAMLAQREQWLPFLGRSNAFDSVEQQELRARLEAALRLAVEEELAAIRSAVAASLSAAQLRELCELMRYAAEVIGEDNDTQPAVVQSIAASAELLPMPGCRRRQLRDVVDLPDAQADKLPAWRAVCEFLLTQEGTLRKTVNKNNGFPSTTEAEKAVRRRCLDLLEALQPGDGLCAALDRVRILPDPRYDPAQWELVLALLELLPIAVAHLKLVFAEEGVIDFSEYAQRALEAIGEGDEPTELGLQLGYCIRHVLVDEFQDTNRTQVELLSRLLRTWESGEDCSIFCVGDPMQSIYSFRQADVAIYQQARRQGIGERRFDQLRELSQNFRSQAGLVEWFNRIFPSILSSESDLTNAVAYSPVVASRPALEGPEAAEIKAFRAGDHAGEAAYVAACIRRQIERPLESGEEPARIAVLVRSRTHLPELVEALRAEGIRYRAVKTDRLADRPHVRDLEALRSAIANPADRTAWLAVLRAPWCGLRLADLLELCRNDRELTTLELLYARLDRLSAEAQSRVARCLPSLEEARERYGRAPLRALVESTWMRLQGPACLDDVREQGMRDAAAYFALLDAESSAGALRDVAGFQKKLHELYAPPDNSPGIQVEIMPIHQAKGLEWDVVFLPALERSVRQDEKRLLYWRSRRAGTSELLLLGPMEARVPKKRSATIESYLRTLANECSREELKRLFYVAATRARKRLYISAAVSEDKKPKQGSMLELLWEAPELRTAFTSSPADPTSPTSDARPELLLRRLPADYIAPPLPPPLHWSRRAVEAPAAEHTFEWAGELARLSGEVTHAYLERIATEGLEQWNAARIEAARPAIAARLRGLGAEPAQLEQAVSRVAEALRRTLADARGRWLLTAHPEHACELSLSAAIDGEIEHVRIDRTFVEDGTRWLIDYKSSVQQGGDLRRWIEMQVEKYRPDMERYARVVRAWDSRPLRCALYLPLLGAFCEVPITGVQQSTAR